MVSDKLLMDSKSSTASDTKLPAGVVCVPLAFVLAALVLSVVFPIVFPVVFFSEDVFPVAFVLPADVSAEVVVASSGAAVSSAEDDEEMVVLSALDVSGDGCPLSGNGVVVGEQPVSKTAADKTAANWPSAFLLLIFLSHPFRGLEDFLRPERFTAPAPHTIR